VVDFGGGVALAGGHSLAAVGPLVGRSPALVAAIAFPATPSPQEKTSRRGGTADVSGAAAPPAAGGAQRVTTKRSPAAGEARVAGGECRSKERAACVAAAAIAVWRREPGRSSKRAAETLSCNMGHGFFNAKTPKRQDAKKTSKPLASLR